MNILHYSLGLPPYRTGGLTKYSFDLMKEQARNGDKVYLLFPGKISLINKKTRIKYNKEQDGISVYEIVNPLPVPLLSGISEPKNFMETCDKWIFEKFLLENNIDIIHIHTFMGLHKELLEACRKLNIKNVYTTHDYFGICTKVNFIDNEGDLCEERNIDKCLKCNKSGYSMNTIRVLQSPMYRFLKNKGIIPKIKEIAKKLKGNKIVISNSANEQIDISQEYRKSYSSLINYYSDMFNYIDRFLFNSNVAKGVYEKYIKCNGKVISITHGDIKDNRKIKDFNHDKLKVTYLGPNKKYKGFDLLIATMKEINKEYKSRIELNLYGDTNKFNIDTNIKFNGRYLYNQLEEIFDSTDLLVVPSVCNETFGFIVLEGLSYGVPVLVNVCVGSIDILNKNINGMVVELSEKSLYEKLKSICNERTILKEFNANIVKGEFEYNLSNHCEEVKRFYSNQ